MFFNLVNGKCQIKKCLMKAKRFFKFMHDYVTYGGAVYPNISEIHYGAILEGKSVLITGGSAGIGLAIAKKCISEGAIVIITGRDEKRLKDAIESVGNPNLKSIVWDVGDTSSHDRLFQKALELLGGSLDILVNNAGIHDGTLFPDVAEEVWDKVYNINSKGLFFLSQVVVKHWLASKCRGKILNLSSSGGFVGATFPYRMTKWDVAGLTAGLGLMLIPHGIIVNGIAPGLTATPMMKREDYDNLYANYSPSFRCARPEEIAELALFLMSDAANYIVGQTIICDGGYCLKS